MVSREEVYQVLNFYWKAGQQIRQEIADARHKKRWQISAGTIYVHLDALVDEGFVETQQREPSPEEEKVRGNCRISEYRKTGTRRSVCYGQEGRLALAHA